jgi:hypothetical protein
MSGAPASSALAIAISSAAGSRCTGRMRMNTAVRARGSSRKTEKVFPVSVKKIARPATKMPRGRGSTRKRICVRRIAS